jgi:hypothetical protein
MQPERRTTILDAAVQVLSRAATPLTAAEIHERIVAAGLFVFGAKDPVAMVRATLQKHVRSIGGARSAHARVKRVDSDRYAAA